MALLEEIIKDIRRDMKHFSAGKLKHEDVQIKVSMYNSILKATNQILNAFSMAAKHGKKIEKRIITTGLLGNGTMIDLSQEEIEEEKIMCPAVNKPVHRHQCLDYSGEAEHIDFCAKCEIGIENKNLLLDSPLHTA